MFFLFKTKNHVLLLAFFPQKIVALPYAHALQASSCFNMFDTYEGGPFSEDIGLSTALDVIFHMTFFTSALFKSILNKNIVCC
jgi:hypothetical protein